MPNNKLNLKPIISPPKKKAKIHSRTLIVEAKDGERRPCSKKIGGGVGKKKKPHDRLVFKKNLD
jgi:hypothetical protein